MTPMARIVVLLRHHAQRTFSSKAGAGKKQLRPQKMAMETQTADVSKLLRPHREPEMAKIYQLNPEAEEIDMFVHEKMADAVQSEYRRTRAHMNWSAARRSMERGPQEPSLLTAAQKAELRRLAAEDPNHWRPQRLAAAFGVSSDAARKLLKGRWQPTSPEEIARHDRKAAARRKALGLPTPSVQQPPPPPPVADASSRPHGPMTALLTMFSAPPPATVAASPERTGAVSAIYSRDEVLQFPVSDTRGDRDSEMRKLDVPVNLSRKHMTLDELKRSEIKMERKKKLKVNPRAPEM